MRPCDRCGGSARDRHHIDGDTANNDPSNIAVLCRTCHMIVDGRLERLHIAGRPKVHPPKPCVECQEFYKPLRRGLCNRCYLRKRKKAAA